VQIEPTSSASCDAKAIRARVAVNINQSRF
jgi:hypothetical protein